MRIELASEATVTAWARLRHALWPHAAPDALLREAQALRSRDDAVCFVAIASDTVIAFAEARLREYVNGCEASPVAFVEGLFVEPQGRGRGVARALIAAIEDWAQARGIEELGSDVLLENVDSQHAHVALGFAETERVVYFRKILTR